MTHDATAYGAAGDAAAWGAAAQGATAAHDAADDAAKRYTVAAFLRDRLPVLGICAITVAAIAFVLGMCAVPRDAIVLVCLVAVGGCVCALAWDYVRRARFYRSLAQAVQAVDCARYAAAVVDEPGFLEGAVTYDALVSLTRLSGDEVAALAGDAKAYRDYVELWVHEAKTPIAAAKLMLARMHGADAQALRFELERVESQVEQVLFYARSSLLSADYAIREVSLAAAVRDACKKHANLLIEHGTVPAVDIPEEQTVFADAAWLQFVLGQLLANAAKYGAQRVRFACELHAGESSRGCVALLVIDDGPGIPPCDLGRIFERGFVGENGRAVGSATGMGLYLAARLCEAMGLGIEAFSQMGSGTTFAITFPMDRRRLDA